MSDSQILWTPKAENFTKSEVYNLINQINNKYSANIKNFHDLYAFSINNLEKFWSEFFEASGIILQQRGKLTLSSASNLLSARWFEDSTLNFAQNLLHASHTNPNQDALVFWCEDKIKRRITFAELNTQVNALRAFFKENNLNSGDRVAAVTSNSPEATLAMLATTAEGAIWSSCSPDFGLQGILDRFLQIQPTILVAVSGYFYKGKYFDITEKICALANSLPTLKSVLLYSLDTADCKQLSGKISIRNLHNILNEYSSNPFLSYQAFPFNHPLYIMFSSGTTGKPKCIVHGAGGTLLEHLKELKLHCNLKTAEKIFYNTTCGWMMWNWLVSALAVGATVAIYDGFPLYNEGNILFDFAEKENLDVFGTSAGFLSAINKAGLRPTHTHNLTKLRTILSTGSVLAPEQYDYVYTSVAPNAQLCSVSGGTDIIGCFALGAPTLPVYRGQLQTRSLGYAVEIYDHTGHPVIEQAGELVCTKPFPSMPIGFWNDPDNVKYKKAYFERFPNIWCHGDYAEITKENGLIIYGRSDTTLNPGGVRIGTAEIYRQLENFKEIALALVTGVIKSFDEEIVLFVKLTEGIKLDASLIEKITNEIRLNASPRHVPRHIIQMPDIPITRSGKVSELTVKRIINKQTVDNLEALANPECLEAYRQVRF